MNRNGPYESHPILYEAMDGSVSVEYPPEIVDIGKQNSKSEYIRYYNIQASGCHLFVGI